MTHNFGQIKNRNSEIADVGGRVLNGARLTRQQASDLLKCSDDDLMLLLDEAFKVRKAFFGTRVLVQVLRNAKSGICSEDCNYCSQSRVSRASIDRYPLVSAETLLSEARMAKTMKATRFCLATSGTRPSDTEIDELCESVRIIKTETGLPLCASVGMVTGEQAIHLKEAGLDRVNHNLNTSRRYYGQICTTHTYQDRLDTVARCREAGLEICCGGIVGQGETDDDIVDLFFALRDIQPEAMPVNFLVPIAGTPFGEIATGLDPRKCLKILCLARLLNPGSEIRAAGGWEYHMRSLKPMALYAADSIFVTGYLTTGGISVQEAVDMIADLGFESTIEEPAG